MLTHDGVIFAEGHFFCGVARVFLGYVEKTGVSSAEQLDFDSGWLRHGPFLWFKIDYMKHAASKQHRSQMRAFAWGKRQSQAILWHIVASRRR